MSRLATLPLILPKAGLYVHLPWDQLYNLYSLTSQHLLNKVSKPKPFSSNFRFLWKLNFSRSTSLWKYLVCRGSQRMQRWECRKWRAEEQREAAYGEAAWGKMGLLPSGAGRNRGRDLWLRGWTKRWAMRNLQFPSSGDGCREF